MFQISISFLVYTHIQMVYSFGDFNTNYFVFNVNFYCLQKENLYSFKQEMIKQVNDEIQNNRYTFLEVDLSFKTFYWNHMSSIVQDEIRFIIDTGGSLILLFIHKYYLITLMVSIHMYFLLNKVFVVFCSITKLF